MRIAIAVEDKNDIKSKVSHHFGRSPYFVIVDMDESKNISKLEIIKNPYYESHSPGDIPEFIHKQNIDIMIVGGIGRRALEFFNQYGIKVATGASGTVSDALNLYFSNKLNNYLPCNKIMEIARIK